MPRCLRLLALSLVVAPFLCSTAQAASTKLRTIDAETVRGLAPLLETGELLLFESKADGRLDQGAVLKLADAGPDTVLEVVARMEEYPRFIPNVVQADVVQKDGALYDVAWELEVPFANLKGVHRVVDDRPDAIRYRAVKGDVRKASFLWQATAVGGGRSIAAHYLSADVREASWFLKKLVEARPEVEPGAVVSTGLVLVKAICDEASRREGKRVVGRPDSKEDKRLRLKTVRGKVALPGVQRSLLRLLRRGVVALIQSHPSGHLKQAVVLNLVDRPPGRVHEVVTTPEHFPDFVPSVREVSITDRSKDRIAYLARIAVPLIDVSVHTELRDLGGPARRVSLKVIGGDIRRGRFAWELLPLGGGSRTLALFYGNTDVRQQSWFLKKLVEKEPFFEHGLNAGLGFVTVDAIRKRAESR